MSEILTVNSEDFLESNKGPYFMVVLTTPHGEYFILPGGTLQRADVGKMDSPLIDRRRLVEDYYAASRSAKANDSIPSGRLDIIPFPTFGS